MFWLTKASLFRVDFCFPFVKLQHRSQVKKVTTPVHNLKEMKRFFSMDVSKKFIRICMDI